jgi:hypothetical protein
MSFMDDVYARVKGRGARVAYPEGLEERAIRAAAGSATASSWRRSSSEESPRCASGEGRSG